MENDLSQSIEVAVPDARWHEAVTEIASRCRLFASTALTCAHAGEMVQAEISIVLADDGFVRDLNHRYRKVDRPTNVLSFPIDDQPGTTGPDIPMLGDIVLAYETVVAEAARFGRPVEAHLAHLIIHGVLHLLGRDHLDDCEAERMEAEEAGILASLGIADPYAAEVAEV